MIKKFIFYILPIITFVLGAQAQDSRFQESPNGWNSHSVNEIKAFRGKKIAVKNNDLAGSVANFLVSQIPSLYNNSYDLAEDQITYSSYGIHLQYRQLAGGIPVYGSMVHVNMSKEGKIYTIHRKLFSGEELSGNLVIPDDPEAHAKTIFPQGENLTAENVFYPEGEKLIPAISVNFLDPEKGVRVEKVIDLEGRLLHSFEMRKHLVTGDTSLPARVFLPDPLTSAKRKYGGNYSDNFDSDSPELNAELKEVLVKVRKKPGQDTLFLAGEACRMIDTARPFNHTARGTDSFFFTRSQKEFEEVNVYYHVSTFYSYMGELGYSDLIDYIVTIDAHGETEDNSQFKDLSKEKGYIVIGDGGVDDGEDADIIIHEYMHAVNHALNPNFYYVGGEGKAIEEGICDYFACSWSRAIDSFNWESLFNWDGHNEFWLEGRSCAVDRIYNPSKGYTDYELGEIWSSALMELWGQIGKKNVDRLMFETLNYLSPGMKMSDAAETFIIVDSILNNKKYNYYIRKAFYKRELTDYGVGMADGKAPLKDITVFSSGSTIQIKLPSVSPNVRIEILSMDGKVLRNFHYSNREEILISSDFSNTQGVYLLRVVAGDRQKVFKFIW